MATTETEPTLAYSSAATWITTLDHLNAAGIPNLVDRNALPPTFSGSSKYEMLGTLRYFDLIVPCGIAGASLPTAIFTPAS